MGGCQAAQAAGWSALCAVTQFSWQMQAIADRATGAAGAISAAGPLSLALLLVLAVVGLAVAWHVFLWVADLIFRYFPLALMATAVLLFVHP